VYCLGYGENGILNRAIQQNSGTPQYWQLFANCAHPEQTETFRKRVTGGGEPIRSRRIQAKIELLKHLQDAGVWLLDASIVGLYKPGSAKIAATKMKQVISECWSQYLHKQILNANPDSITVVGKFVYGVLAQKLSTLGPNRMLVISQPNARLTSSSREDEMRKLRELIWT
jgi:hypothetical protein